MESKWTGTSEDAFFDGDKFDQNRIINKAEEQFEPKSPRNAYYVLGVDVGRKGCQSIVMVLKVVPQPYGNPLVFLVNIFTFEDEHFEAQSLKLKQLFYMYKARRIAIDGNGLGIGLIDFLIKPQTDKASGKEYPDFGVSNDRDGYYKKYETKDCQKDALHIIKANAPINTEIYSYVQVMLNSGHLKLLIDEKTAKAKLLATKVGQQMEPEQRNLFLQPYVYTSILKDEMMNLREDNQGVNIILKKANKAMGKDKFSALGYGLYYIKEEESNKTKRHKKFNAKDWMFMN